MSPLLITVLIVAGIVVLGLIAFINHSLEASKLERARQKAELTDRINRCSNLSDSMPGQFMTPPLKQLLNRLEMQLSINLNKVDRGNPQLSGRIQDLRTQIAMGEAVPIRNPAQPVQNEAQAKEVRFQLEALHAILSHAQREALLPPQEAKQWAGEIRHMLVMLHCEFFNNQGQQNLQQGQARQARLAFERGVQYLRKQPDIKRYEQQLKQLETQLARANAMVLETAQPVADEPSELGEGLKTLDEEDTWKKKNIYD